MTALIRTTITKKAAARGFVLVLIMVGCIVDREPIMEYQAELEEKKIEKRSVLQASAIEDQRNERLAKDSEIAMERVKKGCTVIIQTQNNKPIRFNSELRVFDANTFPRNSKTPRFDKAGNPINGVQPMPGNITICNEFGDTAITVEGGNIVDIRRALPSKLSEFRSYL